MELVVAGYVPFSLYFRADAHLSRLVVSSRRWEIGILEMADEPRPGLCS